ncbi:MAG: FAD-dependent oxidoreductase [Bacteroidetes bacterium]|nr:FAD-dependent oxidoreductase [Bacteroidota bacterium]
MKRREFLAQATLAGMAISLPSFVLPNSKKINNTSVIIIGAGFAGLAAAYQLFKKNIPFILLESRSRYGGRVFSHALTPRLVVELGGEWVGASHTRIRELCDEMNLTLENNQMDTHLIYKNQYFAKGKWDYSNAWKQKFEHIIKTYPQLTEEDKKQLDQYDWWRYLVNNGCTGRDLEIRELLDSTDFGESIRHVSAFAALAEYAESSPKNEMDFKIKGGNSKLADAIVAKIGKQNINLNHTVTHIIQNNKVEVRCSNGKSFIADKIICTAPTFALQKINWSPELTPAYKNALNELQYARITKRAFAFSKRFWKDESFDLITDQAPHYFYHASKNQPGPSGALISYSIGDKALINADYSNTNAAREMAACLEPFFGPVKKLLKAQQYYYWGQDIYSQGAYAMYGIGQWFTIRPQLLQPHLHTHFAGEHLADWQGFMEGAINTGEDAASNIIQ